MVIMDKEELPKPGHVMAIIEAMNKSNDEKFKECVSPSRNSVKSFGIETSLIFTKTSLSVSSSSLEGSITVDCINNCDELEAIYDNRYSPLSTNKPFSNHLCQTKAVCVCQKKKCDYLKAHKKISKSLTDLDDSSSLHGNLIGKNTITKYFSYKREKRTKDPENLLNRPKTLTTNYAINSANIPIERFQISNNFLDESNFENKCEPKHKLFLNSIYKRKPRTICKDLTDGNINGHTTLAEPEFPNIYSSNYNDDIADRTSIKKKEWRTKFQKGFKNCCYLKKLSCLRIIFLFIGVFIILTGIAYDIGLRFIVNSAFYSCWGWLRKEYINFGENFIEYQKHVFNTRLPPDPLPVDYDANMFYVSNELKGTSYNVEDKFLHVLENLQFSFQIHFFNMMESIPTEKSTVKVNDIGPLYIKLFFKKDRGFEVKYIPNKSNMTLSTTFEVYDIMKALLLSNQIPYFGFHIKDHYKTTPNALLKVFIDTLTKFRINTSFLSTLKSQIQKSTEISRKKRTANMPEKLAFKNIVHKLFLPPPTIANKTISLPTTTFNRNFTVKYRNNDIISGIKCYNFILRDETNPVKRRKLDQMIHLGNELIRKTSFKNKDKKPPYTESFPFYSSKKIPNQMGFTNRTLPPDVIDLNPIILDIMGENILFLGKNLRSFPFWISSPHFISNGLNDSLSQNIMRDRNIDGLTPSEARHGSFVYYHPILGVPMNASLAIQIGVYPPKEMLHAQKLVPIMWIRIQLDQMYPTLWYLFWISFYIRIIFIILFVSIGLVIILCVLKCRCGKTADEEMV